MRRGELGKRGLRLDRIHMVLALLVPEEFGGGGGGKSVKLSQRLQDERAFVERIFGDLMICADCKATLKTFADACTAGLSDPCQGYLAIERAKRAFSDARRLKRDR